MMTTNNEDYKEKETIVVVPIEGMPGHFRAVKPVYIRVSYNELWKAYQYDPDGNIKVLCYQ